MSRRRRSGHGRSLVATVLAVVTLLHASVAPPAAARTVAGGAGDVLKVTLKIAVQGEGAAAAVEKWKAIFDRVWGSLQGSNACGKKLQFELLIVAPQGFQDPGYDLITVRPVPDGSYEVSNVTGGVNNPTGTDRGGTWSSNATDAIVAHEMGHLLGLGDEYSYIDKNGNGTRDKSEPSRPDPNKAPEYEFEHDWDGDGKVDWDDADGDGKWTPGEREDTTRLKPGKTASIMAGPPGNVNNILNRHLETIAQQHGVSPCKKGYRMRGNVQGLVTIDDPDLVATYTIEIDVLLASGEPGPIILPSGERVGRIYPLSHEGTVLRNTYHWQSKETGDTCTGAGEVTLAAGANVAQIYVEDRPVDTTPAIGFDIPDAGTLYAVFFDANAFSYPVTCSFGATLDGNYLWPTLGRVPGYSVWPYDLEIRSLDANGGMSGSYVHTAPTISAGTWTMEAQWELLPEEEAGVG